jgi:hypothetical protein
MCDRFTKLTVRFGINPNTVITYNLHSPMGPPVCLKYYEMEQLYFYAMTDWPLSRATQLLKHLNSPYINYSIMVIFSNFMQLSLI